MRAADKQLKNEWRGRIEDYHTKCVECGWITRWGKPYCIEHLDLIEEVIELKRRIEAHDAR